MYNFIISPSLSYPYCGPSPMLMSSSSLIVLVTYTYKQIICKSNLPHLVILPGPLFLEVATWYWLTNQELHHWGKQVLPLLPAVNCL